MQCIIMEAKANEFTTKDGTLLKGVSLTILRENFTIGNYWVSQDKLGSLGFNPKMVTNPFTSDEFAVTDVTFDEKPGYKGAPSKIVPTGFAKV